MRVRAMTSVGMMVFTMHMRPATAGMLCCTPVMVAAASMLLQMLLLR
jgi:hypothetical protein